MRTFGNFEVFCDGKPITFTYGKTKEMLAYIIDRNGAMCPNREIIGILWEDSAENDHVSYFKNCRSDLLTTLDKIGCGDVIIRQRGGLGVVKDMISCDYYDVLDGRSGLYRGEYMSQYDWAEVTHASLEKIM